MTAEASTISQFGQLLGDPLVRELLFNAINQSEKKNYWRILAGGALAGGVLGSFFAGKQSIALGVGLGALAGGGYGLVSKDVKKGGSAFVKTAGVVSAVGIGLGALAGVVAGAAAGGVVIAGVEGGKRIYNSERLRSMGSSLMERTGQIIGRTGDFLEDKMLNISMLAVPTLAIPAYIQHSTGGDVSPETMMTGAVAGAALGVGANIVYEGIRRFKD